MQIGRTVLAGMRSSGGLGVGAKLVAVAVFLLATQCLGAVPTPPSSRATGYTTSVDLKLPKSSPARGEVVLESEGFQLYLEGDDLNKCSLSVREMYTGRGSPVNRPGDRGFLLWSANYYSKTPTGAEKCTLTFTATGDLQLWIVVKGKTSLTWSSGTANKGVTKMALGTNPDNGNFKLVTASNKAVFNSFDFKEWLILFGQKLWVGETLKSPDQVYPDNDTRVLANGGTYILAIVGGDLQLLLNGPKPEPYWSVKRDLGFSGDLSKVAYVAIPDHVKQGIGLFTAAGELVYRIEVPPFVLQYGADYNFGIDSHGNLKYNFMYKGMAWGAGWQALTDPCGLPNYCGHYGFCASADQFGVLITTCTGCPEGFTVDSSTKPAGCKRKKAVNKCKDFKYLELSGYEPARFGTPTVETSEACRRSCSTDCNCDGVVYNVIASHCFKISQFGTLKKTTINTGTISFIKI